MHRRSLPPIPLLRPLKPSPTQSTHPAPEPTREHSTASSSPSSSPRSPVDAAPPPVEPVVQKRPRPVPLLRTVRVADGLDSRHPQSPRAARTPRTERRTPVGSGGKLLQRRGNERNLKTRILTADVRAPAGEASSGSDDGAAPWTPRSPRPSARPRLLSLGVGAAAGQTGHEEVPRTDTNDVLALSPLSSPRLAAFDPVPAPHLQALLDELRETIRGLSASAPSEDPLFGVFKAVRDYEALRRQPMPASHGPVASSGRELGQLVERNLNLQRSLESVQQSITQCRHALSGMDRTRHRELPPLQAKVKDGLIALREHARYLMDAADLSTQEVALHARARIPINDATRQVLVDERHFIPGSEEALGEGQTHRVSVHEVRVPLPDGTHAVKRLVFKPEPPADASPPDVAGLLRLAPEQPNFSGRAVATSRLNDALGLDLVPRTDFAIHAGQLGVVMELAPGTPVQSTHPVRLDLPEPLLGWWRAHPHELQAFAQARGYSQADIQGATLVLRCWREEVEVIGGVPQSDGDRARMRRVPGEVLHALDFHDPVLRERLVELNFLSALTGQVDHHLGNYAVERDPQGHVTRLQAFDNDLSFGAASLSIESLYMDGTGSMGLPVDYPSSHATQLPEVISRRCADALLALTPERLRATLDGLVTEDEQLACVRRLAEIQEHVQHLVAEGRVVDPAAGLAWTDPLVGEWLGLDRIDNASHDPHRFDAFAGSMARHNFVARDALRTEKLRRHEAQRTPGDGAPPLFDAVELLGDLQSGMARHA